MLTPFMNLSKKKMLVSSFFNSQFSYCPLVWICYGRMITNKINHLNERCLRVIYKDKISSFKELLERDWFVAIHIRIFRYLPLRSSKFITIWLREKRPNTEFFLVRI